MLTLHLVALAMILFQGFQCNSDHHGESEILSKLELSPATDYLEIKIRRNITLTCRGTGSMTWYWEHIPYYKHSRMEEKSEKCSEPDQSHLICSYLTLTKAQVNDTGYISCRYKHQNKRNLRLQAKIYLYVKDINQPFLEMNNRIPGIAYMDVKAKELFVPCRVSSPKFKVTLHYFQNKAKIYQRGMEWDPKIGFTIPSPHHSLYEILQCETEVKGKHYYTMFWKENIVQSKTEITNVEAERTTLLAGETLHLTCTGEAPYNSRVILDWVHDKKVLNSVKKIYDTGSGYMGDRILEIKNVTKKHSGIYFCMDANFPNVANNISITVYEKPFLKINGSPENCQVHVALEGSELKLSVKVKAFPPPQSVWFKDGKLIEKNSTCYRTNPEKHSLVIRNLKENDAGIYTLLVFSSQHNLQDKYNFTVKVHVKPKILEKETDFNMVEPVLLGESRRFQCTAYGNPLPSITWEWQPCLYTSTTCEVDPMVKRIPISSYKKDNNDNDTQPLIEEVQVTQEENNRIEEQTRRFWVHPINELRDSRGHIGQLYHELRRYPEKFYNFVRMPMEAFDKLQELLSTQLRRQDTRLRQAINPTERLLITLRFLATGESYSSLHLQFRVGKSTVSGIVRSTCHVIWQHLQPISMPSPTQETWLQAAAGFQSVAQFPNCIGAVDGKHVRVQQPPRSGSQYYNYKKYFSVVLMAVADANYKYLAIDVGAYGSTGDSRVLSTSDFGQQVLRDQVTLPPPKPLPGTTHPVPFVMVSDEAFPLMNNLLRPYPQRGLNARKRVFNARLSRARRFVECTFGIMSSKWRIFTCAMQLDEATVDAVIKAACVLHNFVRDYETLDLDVDTHVALNDSPINWGLGRPSNSAVLVRETFADYFMSPEGAVSWQV